MKRILLAIYAVVVAFALIGCGATMPVAPQTRTIFIEPSAALTRNCNVSAPPDKNVFIKATDEERWKMLQRYGISLLTDMKTCNAQWETLRQWVASQKEIYTKDNKK